MKWDSLAAGPCSGVSLKPGLQASEEAPQGPAVVHSWPWFISAVFTSNEGVSGSRGGWSGDGPDQSCLPLGTGPASLPHQQLHHSG